MTQNKLKISLSVLATILGLVVAGAAAGTVHIHPAILGWLSLAASAMGIFGASPIGRVVGNPEKILPRDQVLSATTTVEVAVPPGGEELAKEAVAAAADKLK